MLKHTTRMAIAAAALLGAGLANAADITIKVDGVMDERGTVRLMLFNAASWPRMPDKEVGVAAVKGGTTVVMKDVAPGEYLVVAYHDQDGDGNLTMHGKGMPFEPFALTRNPDIAGGPPAFAKASFVLTDKGYSETLTLHGMP